MVLKNLELDRRRQYDVSYPLTQTIPNVVVLDFKATVVVERDDLLYDVKYRRNTVFGVDRYTEEDLYANIKLFFEYMETIDKNWKPYEKGSPLYVEPYKK